MNSPYFNFPIVFLLFCLIFTFQTISCIFQDSEMLTKILNIILIIIVWIMLVYLFICYIKLGKEYFFNQKKQNINYFYTVNIMKKLFERMKERKIFNEEYKSKNKPNPIYIEKHVDDSSFQNSSITGISVIKSRNEIIQNIRKSKFNHKITCNYICHKLYQIVSLNV